MPLLDIQAQLEENVNMREDTRMVLYNHGHHDGDDTAPTLTRYRPGEWRPAVKQMIYGNPEFSTWQSLHGTHTRLSPLDRTNLARATTKPIRLWDAGSFPSSTPPNTYIPNPSQLSAGNVTSTAASGNVGYGSQDAYSLYYSRFGK